jgi:TonB family protein
MRKLNASTLAFLFVTQLFLLVGLAAVARAQSCGLKVGAWESLPASKMPDGGLEQERKSTVEDFTATAVNVKTNQVYKGEPMGSLVYFKDIPEGQYKVTLTGSGYKTTVQSHRLMCDGPDASDLVYVQMVTGDASEIVMRETPPKVPPRDPNKFTVYTGPPLGDDPAAAGPPSPARRAVRIISGGVLNSKAISLPQPVYPPAARSVGASGAVQIQVLVDETGKVISASAAGGHPLLQAAAVVAARQAVFAPTLLSGQPVKVSGILTYIFRP